MCQVKGLDSQVELMQIQQLPAFLSIYLHTLFGVCMLHAGILIYTILHTLYVKLETKLYKYAVFKGLLAKILIFLKF